LLKKIPDNRLVFLSGVFFSAGKLAAYQMKDVLTGFSESSISEVRLNFMDT
jgi:hypothetical protein